MHGSTYRWFQNVKLVKLSWLDLVFVQLFPGVHTFFVIISLKTARMGVKTERIDLKVVPMCSVHQAELIGIGVHTTFPWCSYFYGGVHTLSGPKKS